MNTETNSLETLATLLAGKPAIDVSGQTTDAHAERSWPPAYVGDGSCGHQAE